MDKELEVKNSTKKMIMYFIVFSITMLFGGLVSAYIVGSLGQYWVHITPPTIWISNALLILSSLTLYLSIKNIRKGIERSAKALLLATLLLVSDLQQLKSMDGISLRMGTWMENSTN